MQELAAAVEERRQTLGPAEEAPARMLGLRAAAVAVR
jgi:hypothetical protein